MTTTLQLLLALVGTQPPPTAVPVDSPPPAPPAPQQLRAVRLNGGQGASIGGNLNEALWQAAERVTAFTQRDSPQRAGANHRTVVYISKEYRGTETIARFDEAHLC